MVKHRESLDDMLLTGQDTPHDASFPGRMAPRLHKSWDRVPERQINLSILRGGQDPQIEISYIEWACDTRDYIKGNGRQC